MAADTFSTDGIGAQLMGIGNDNNTWGSNLNSNAIQVLVDAVANRLDNTVTGGTLDLSGSPPPAAASQARYAFLLFVGTLTSNQTVVLPNLAKFWVIQNSTSGAFSLLVKASGGVATQIPQGALKRIFCYPTSTLVAREDVNEIGEIKDFATAAVPGGYLECDGAAYSRTSYPDLFAKISTTWGLGTGGDGTTFGVPNLKDTGRFRRSRTGLVAVGTYQANQNLAHTHTGTATGTTGNVSADHTHAYSGTTSGHSVDHTHTASNSLFYVGTTHQSVNNSSPTVDVPSTTTNMQGVSTGGASADHTHTYSGTSGVASANHTHTFTSGTITTSSNGGTEARPEAAVVLSCIRY